MGLVKKNEVYEGEVVDLTHEGHGVVKKERYPIFIPQTLVDEKIKYKVIKVKKNFAIGKLIEVQSPSQDRVEPPCVYYQQCGGCQLQHLSYEAQLEMKRKQVINLFHHKGKMTHVPIHPTVGMEHPWHYRNKSQIPVGTGRHNEVEMGFYRQRSHQIIDMEQCLIQYDDQNEMMNMVKDLLKKYHIAPYDEQQHKGLVRHLVVRKGYYTQEIMVIFVINGTKLPYQDEIVAALTQKFKNIKSIKLNFQHDRSNVIMGKASRTIYGQEIIEDQLEQLTFEIGDLSFYQINVTQTQKLYAKALEYAKLTGRETVLDAYCGIGTIGLFMAPHAKHVYGVEVVPEAIEDAQRNAQKNHISNTTFVAGAAEDVILKWQKEGIQPDVVTVDPPRKGCDETFIQTLNQLAPQRIVYVSCNPSTQLRDIESLTDQYELKEITPVDMFPHTTHVETVALLERK
ncbi:23S rRNA (uracil(1939)-C(5))-methyltransferase RlmD [Staphylococcus coagulans]|uniref:23S rRNA (uracil(1939)-C(5))-methyltransferase RlmD n=1 Tax=Staphylococcus coagulans TaxID=74706 RepID=UPI001BE9B931|nr:23S rRNA (uracil(1939)-C(5))-methyltransferase RlmD [Staphylococcus coagulans]MBT2814892.1 23S rRNA (uracil(1939)-C(5))-methyltransferase RlmD [Staphylococcus coagulans]MBT2817390.1 23S rRNA (uracil(1939)-C(5))-methyltransferase RlmD [Staphylococcus coagulans]MBT2837988.1 23S rRNA (uracil(1939)-C(5))-methyltransferase RlmD [Staphylococcus coagulans]MBT2842530.1 23S rRNA (uracil(1939)-C(5))-methyltransferase RlmD [Staphylococcus coagulans]MBT2849121.1 23S rRNA (uracil(1939)-C(5))-methyltrans